MNEKIAINAINAKNSKKSKSFKKIPILQTKQRIQK